MAKATNCYHEQFVTGDLKSVRLLRREANDELKNGRQSLFMKDDALLFVIDGQVQCRHGGDFHLLNEHQFIFFRKGILLELMPLMPQAQLLLCVIKRELIIQFADMASRNTPGYESKTPVIRGETDELLISFCDMLSNRLRQEGNIPEPLLTIKMLELLFQLSSNHPAIAAQIMDCRERWVPDIPAIIEEKLMDDVPLSQLARLAGRSLSSFRRDFLSIYNMAPSRWIRQKKLEKAQQLLSNTNMTITEVCYIMGFQSNAHFSRVFKTCFGYRPSDMRRPTLPVDQC